MEFSQCCTEKRYCMDGEELLRAIVSIPSDTEDDSLRVLADLCKALSDRSLLFAEERLFPSICAEYEGLSPHDRKFAIPRRVYRVDVRAETVTDEAYGEAIRMTVSVTLRRKGRTEFSRSEVRLWAKYGKNPVFMMVNAQRKTKKDKDHQKTQENIHFVHK